MNEIAHKNKHWFALYTKPRQEFKAAAQLNSISVGFYLPTFVSIRKWSDRKKKIEVPLFNGYIFIYASEKERLMSVEQKAIVRTISFQGKPSIIPDWQIESLKKLLAETPDVFITDKIETGEHIKIVSGPFEGIVGIVKKVNSENWLIISLELLNRSVSAKLPRESVIKIVEK
jgi:transcription termination/antitermination protein NusG